MKWILETATLAHAEELSALVNSAYRGDSSRQGWTTEADFLDGQRTDPETLKADIAQPRNTILCLRNPEDRKLVACVYLEKVEGNRTYLGMLTVKPTLQASGIGRYLLEAAEAYAREKGSREMILGVIQIRDSLMAWYERRGYKRTGETKPFPYGNEAFGKPLRPDLHFIFFAKSL